MLVSGEPSLEERLGELSWLAQFVVSSCRTAWSEVQRLERRLDEATGESVEHQGGTRMVGETCSSGTSCQNPFAGGESSNFHQSNSTEIAAWRALVPPPPGLALKAS